MELMKNNIFKTFLAILFSLIYMKAYSAEQFNFDVTEVRILENGNKFIGDKRGKIISNDGVIINANQFVYDKLSNILNASGEVEIFDTINKYKIYSKKITYKKNQGLIFTEHNSKAISLDHNIEITAKYFEYNKIQNIITAKSNVIINDKLKNYKIYSNNINYFLNEERIYSKGKTKGNLKLKYSFNSEDVTLLRNSMELSSYKNSTITDKLNLYKLSKFKYLMQSEELKGEDIIVITNYKLPKSDKFYFDSAIIDLNNQNFVATDTKIKVHKEIFDNSENDPRLKGVSSIKRGPITTINKGVFTSCKENDDCPPWSIQAKKIIHDKEKKQLNYNHALLRLYDIPVFYFPKFFHPDPTVKRQSGILKPVLNNSNVLGSSLTIPYYHVISHNSDITTTPTLFDNSAKLLQNEFRKVSKNYNFITNFGHARGYNSKLLNKKKNITYFFSKIDFDLDLKNFETSKMKFNIEKVTNDNFLKVFETNLIDNTNSIKPQNLDSLTSELKFIFSKENYNFTTGIQSFENLQLKNSDRYQYVLPYYNFNTNLFPNFKHGSINLNSTGNNNLNNTNQLKTEIINDISYSSLNFISSNGIKNNFNVNLKNLNSTGKNISEYKSSPEVQLSSIFELNSILPLKKQSLKYVNYLTPKASLRWNPNDMEDHTLSKRTINTDNIFSIDRLGLDDSFETGKSITLGLDYKKETIDDMNKYFNLKLATVFRDKKEAFIPRNTTLNKKSSNIFGSVSANLIDHINLNYKFAADNNLNDLEYSDINATLSVNNFVTSFNFVKEMGDMGDQNFIKNTTSYKIDDNNFIKFNTRRNRKLNLTEFYDLVYEYKNDCLTAGIKYKKTYYEDRDLKPTEDLLFTITIFPLTNYEHKVDKIPNF